TQMAHKQSPNDAARWDESLPIWVFEKQEFLWSSHSLKHYKKCQCDSRGFAQWARIKHSTRLVTKLRFVKRTEPPCSPHRQRLNFRRILVLGRRGRRGRTCHTS